MFRIPLLVVVPSVLVFVFNCGGSTGDDLRGVGQDGGAGSAGVGGSSGSTGSGGSSAGSAGTSATGGGSGIGGSAGSIGAVDCQRICEKRDAANCPSDPPIQTCVSNCTTGVDAIRRSCGPELEALGACVQARGTYSCNSSGESELSGCDPETRPYAVCAACIPAQSDTACQTCMKQSCCSQTKAFLNDPNFSAYQACVQACTDTQCEQACLTRYPSLTAAAQALVQCRQASCSSQCP